MRLRKLQRNSRFCEQELNRDKLKFQQIGNIRTINVFKLLSTQAVCKILGAKRAEPVMMQSPTEGSLHSTETLTPDGRTENDMCAA